MRYAYSIPCHILKNCHNNGGLSCRHPSVDGDVITVNIKQNGIAADFYSLTQGDADVKDSWDQLVQNQVSLCDQFKKSSSDLGRDDIMFIVQLLNDANPDNVLVSVVDGTVYYNAADDVE